MDFAPAIALLRQQLSDLQAVYLFGSLARGKEGPLSDIDLAILIPHPLDAMELWELNSQLAGLMNETVDLVDLRAASTVMCYQVVQHGRRLWRRDSQADEFELTTLSQYWDLEITRRELLEDIKQRGSIYGG